MTDSLTSPTSAKSLGVIDAILDVRKSVISWAVLSLHVDLKCTFHRNLFCILYSTSCHDALI